MRAVCVLLVLAWATCSAQTARSVASSPPAESAASIHIPLIEGKLRASDLLRELCDAAGLGDPLALDVVDWTIDVQTLSGRLQLALLERASDRVITISVDGDQAVVNIDRARLSDEGEKLAKVLGLLTARNLREHSAAADGDPPIIRYGLSVCTDEHARAPLEQLAAINEQRVVLLVHGVDDPGWMWRDLIPQLRCAGFTVLRFDYPNDGAISDSADLLARELEKLHLMGARHVDVIAKSMGGLVCRDVLTRKAYYDGDGSGGERFPAIDHLIMVGTPNHGSNMAHLERLADFGEHLSRAFRGQENWADFESDGMGEAGVDLRPGSVFLTRLNARPLARHTNYTIIAGQISPLSGDDVERWTSRVRRLANVNAAPPWLRRWAGSTEADVAEQLVSAAANGIGDGLVTIESAKLESVDDLVLVRADHIGMIVNVVKRDRTPPAIPIILQRLHH